MIDRLAAAIGSRPKRALLAAAAFFLLALGVGAPVAGRLTAHNADFQDQASPSVRAARLIEQASGQSATFGVVALVRGRGDARTDPRARRKVAAVARLLAASPGVLRVLDYPGTALPELVSTDGRSSVILASFVDQDRSTAAVDRLRGRLAGHRVAFGGADVAFSEINTRTSSDLAHAEEIAIPILLLLSFGVFRGLIAALLPLLVGLAAILASLLGMRAVNAVSPLSIFALNLVTGMGLGLAIDYSLFIVSRYREELAGVGDPRVAIERTLQTAGRTVLFSALTVAGALAALLVFPLRFLYSMGVGGALVALSAGAVSLTVLPAVLVLLGPRINAVAPARLQRSRARSDRPAESGAWYRLGAAVMRRPAATALLVTAALIAGGLPSLRLALAPASALALPPSSETRQVAEALTRDFPSDGSQRITVVVPAPADAYAQLGRLGGQVARLTGEPAAGRFLGRGVWELDVLPHGDAVSAANQRLVARLRALSVATAGGPAAGQRLVARLRGLSVAAVGGPTAAFVDQKSAIASQLPLALAILAAATIGVLFLMTGSVVLPLIALAMNVLTAAVAAGLIVLIFQDGRLGGLLGFRPIGGLEESNLVLLFVVVFALSTDYGVFLFARIREARESGLESRAAVAFGLERTGRLITAAALLFCVAIGAFATSQIFFVKQLGVGAAIAVAVDATVVRGLLVPALLGVLGDRAWWAPAPLRRLHAAAGLGEDGSAAAR
ncbi:MAG: MMPL family transporter [Solirubrobacteraceae bacterium]